jgi:hypothetical protein
VGPIAGVRRSAECLRRSLDSTATGFVITRTAHPTPPPRHQSSSLIYGTNGVRPKCQLRHRCHVPNPYTVQNSSTKRSHSYMKVARSILTGTNIQTASGSIGHQRAQKRYVTEQSRDNIAYKTFYISNLHLANAALFAYTSKMAGWQGHLPFRLDMYRKTRLVMSRLLAHADRFFVFDYIYSYTQSSN